MTIFLICIIPVLVAGLVGIYRRLSPIQELSARYSAHSIARYTGRVDVRNAGRYVLSPTITFFIWGPAAEGDWVARTCPLEPTVSALQASIVELVQRMEAVKRARRERA
jgi:hypothetical protein